MSANEVRFDPPLPLPLDETAGRLFDRLCRMHATLLKAQAALNPASVLLRNRTPEMEGYLERLREEIRAALVTGSSDHRPGYFYVATPYTKYPHGHEVAWLEACRMTAVLVKAGVAAVSPIVHSHPLVIHVGVKETGFNFWKLIDMPLMSGAVGMIVVRMDGWQESFGISEERKVFKAARKPILDVPPTVLLEDPERVARVCRALSGG